MCHCIHPEFRCPETSENARQTTTQKGSSGPPNTHEKHAATGRPRAQEDHSEEEREMKTENDRFRVNEKCKFIAKRDCLRINPCAQATASHLVSALKPHPPPPRRQKIQTSPKACHCPSRRSPHPPRASAMTSPEARTPAGRIDHDRPNPYRGFRSFFSPASPANGLLKAGLGDIGRRPPSLPLRGPWGPP